MACRQAATACSETPYSAASAAGVAVSRGGHNEGQKLQLALLWVLNQSDGSKSLLDIAEMAGLPFDLVHQAAEALLHNQLLEVVVR